MDDKICNVAITITLIHRANSLIRLCNEINCLKIWFHCVYLSQAQHNKHRWSCKLHVHHTVYPKKYAHGFVVFCFVVVMQSFIMNSHEVFIHIHQGCFAGTGTIVRLPQCQWSKPDGYGIISQCITTTKHSKAKTVCIFLGKYRKYPGRYIICQKEIMLLFTVVHFLSMTCLYVCIYNAQALSGQYVFYIYFMDTIHFRCATPFSCWDLKFFWANHVNTMAAADLAPVVATLSAAMIFTV